MAALPLVLAAAGGAALRGWAENVLGGDRERPSAAAAREAQAAQLAAREEALAALRCELRGAREDAAAAREAAETSAATLEEVQRLHAETSAKAAAAADSLLRRVRGEAGKLAAENKRLSDALEGARAALGEARAAAADAEGRARELAARAGAEAAAAGDESGGDTAKLLLLEAAVAAEADDEGAAQMPVRLTLTSNTRMARLLEAGVAREDALRVARKQNMPPLLQGAATPPAVGKARKALKGLTVGDVNAQNAQRAAAAKAHAANGSGGARRRLELPAQDGGAAAAKAGLTVGAGGRVQLIDRPVSGSPSAPAAMGEGASWMSRRRASRAARKAAREAAIDLLGSDDEGAFAGRGGGKAVMLR